MFDNDLGIDTSWRSNHFYLYYQGDNLYNLLYDLKWKTETKSHTVGTALKSNRKNVETVKIDTSTTHIHDGPLSWLGTGISIKNGRGKRVLRAPNNIPSTRYEISIISQRTMSYKKQ